MPRKSGFAPGFTMRDGAGETWFVSFDPDGLPGGGDRRHGRRQQDLLGARLLPGREPPDRGPARSARHLRGGDVHGAIRHAPADAAAAISTTSSRRAQRSADGTYRAVAGRALPGTVLGGFRYYGTRPDDPNDVVPHEHRRELRALKVFGAWTNLVDMKAGNTLDTLIEVNGRGVVRHYLQDVGSTFGSGAIGPATTTKATTTSTRAGRCVKRALLFGFPLPPWATVPYPTRPSSAASRDRRSTRRGGSRAPRPRPSCGPGLTTRSGRRGASWRSRDDMIRAIAKTGVYSNPAAAPRLAEVLIARRDRIARAYLPAVNPVVDVALSADGALTFGNAAVDAGVAPKPTAYAVEWARFDNATGATTPIGARAVVATPRASAPDGLPNAPGAYVSVRISATDGPKPWTTPVQAYFRRTAAGWLLVGLDRLP